MSARRGFSLVEVLVASILLTVGVAGSLSALVTAARLRALASAREAVAQALDSRLDWFATNACAFTGDTVVRAQAGTGTVETWRVRRDSSGAVLAGRVEAGVGPHTVRRALSVARSCP